MTARIVTIEHWDRDELFVPGTDPAQIIADGNAWIAKEGGILGISEEAVVTTPSADIRIGWYRVNPCGTRCYCGGGYAGHWVPTEGQTRGGFQGATVTIDVPSETPAVV